MKDLDNQLIERIDTLLGGEIKDLKFGCDIENKITGDVSVVLDGNVFGGKILHWNWTINEARILEKDDVIILGRPINLEDVMRAIKMSTLSEMSIINGREDFVLVGHKELTLSNFAPWQLGKDILSQSEETKQSIAEILGIK